MKEKLSIIGSIMFGALVFTLISNAEYTNSPISPPSGSTSITTLGTVTTGTWEGNKIGIGYGGTNATNATDARTNLGLGTIATQNADNATITGGSVTGLTNLGAANLTVTSDTTLGTTNIGSTTAGKNLTVNATLGNEMSPALEAANWTATDGWSAGSGTLVKVAGTGTGTATPSGTFTVTAGRRYEVVIVCSAVSGTLIYTLGGVSGTVITATTITDEIIAKNTGKIIFSGGASVTATITSVSVKDVTAGTGDLAIGGTLKPKGQIQAGISYTYPSYSFSESTNSGMFYNYIYGVGFSLLGNAVLKLAASGIHVLGGVIGIAGSAGGNPDTYLYRDGTANMFALKNSTNQQIFRIYNTADAHPTLTNYERLSITGVAGSSLNLTAETAGTGADNLDIIITPAGTGETKVIGPLTKKSGTTGTGGGLRRTLTEATSGTLSGATGTISVNVPSGARIHGVQLRVDTAITFSGTDTTWKAVYVNTPTTAICSGQAIAKDTKFSAIHPAYEITTGTVTITVSSDGSDTFTGGNIRAVVYYEDLTALSNAPCTLFTIGDSKTASLSWQPGLVASLTTEAPTCSWSYESEGVSGSTVATWATYITTALAEHSDLEYQYLVLINLGVNELGSLPAEATWKANYQTIIDAVHAKWPYALIYLAKPWKYGKDTEAATVAGWIDGLIAANSGLCFEGIDENVWFKNGVAIYSDDGIHYNTAGSAEADNQWVTVLGY